VSPGLNSFVRVVSLNVGLIGPAVLPGSGPVNQHYIWLPAVVCQNQSFEGKSVGERLEAELVELNERCEGHTSDDVENDFTPANDSSAVHDFNAQEKGQSEESAQGCSLPTVESLVVVEGELDHVQTGFDVGDHQGVQAYAHEVDCHQLRKRLVLPELKLSRVVDIAALRVACFGALCSGV